MTRSEFEKLLGGYATGTLNAGERKALFQAAMEDQELFDALMEEQALKDTLDDAACRSRILAELRSPSEPFHLRAWRALWRPGALALAGAVASTLLIVAVVRNREAAPGTQQIAMSKSPAPRIAAAPVPPPAEKPNALVANEPLRLERDLRDQVAPAKKKAAKEEKAQAEYRSTPAQVADIPSPEAPPRSAPAGRTEAVGGAVTGSVVGGVVGGARDSGLAATEARVNPPGAVPRAALERRDQRTKDAAVVAPAPVAGFVEPQNTVQLGKQAVAESAAAGIPYQVLRQDAAGEFVPAAAGAVFRPGESLRLRFEPTREGILAVTDPDSRAQLYHGRVESGKPVIVPASGSLKLSDEPGVRRLGVRFTSAGTLRSMLSQESAVRGAVPVAAPAAVQFEIVLRYR